MDASFRFYGILHIFDMTEYLILHITIIRCIYRYCVFLLQGLITMPKTPDKTPQPVTLTPGQPVWIPHPKLSVFSAKLPGNQYHFSTIPVLIPGCSYIHLFLYSIGVLPPTQEHFTYTTVPVWWKETASDLEHIRSLELQGGHLSPELIN